MGQKVIPISLRIGLNRNFDSSFFQDLNYDTVIAKELFLHKYFQSLFKKTEFLHARTYSSLSFKKYSIRFFHLKKTQNQDHTFSQVQKNKTSSSGYESFQKAFQSNKQPIFKKIEKNKNSSISDWLSDHLKSSSFFYSLGHTEKILLSFLLFSTVTKQKGFSIPFNLISSLNFLLKKIHLISESQIPLSQPLEISNEGTQSKIVNNSFFHFELDPNYRTAAEKLSLINLFRPIKIQTKIGQKENLVQRLPCLESNVESYLGCTAVLIPFQLCSITVSAQLVASFIASQLEQNKPFRKIMKQIITQMKNSTSVKGVRIMCAGRLGGVEMARVESRKWGQTSLHVFSSHIDYSSQTAHTVYGLIGIKVWVCYTA